MINKLGAIILIIWASMQPAVAQLPPGSIAPDFTVEDINGEPHHLYDLLSGNKIVLLEISATWCPPCWAYHQSRAMQDFYDLHGPLGDDQARVFWVEGDPATNIACIYDQPGCNDNSTGNFAQGTPYPILNSADIANAFQITYFPSIFVICPNKRVYEVNPVSAEDLWEKAQVCPVAFGENNAGIFAHDPGYDLPEICGAVNLLPSFMLTNLGSEPLTSASILLKWNGMNVETINWTGTLPTYGEAFIQFDSFPISEAGTLNTVISSINNNIGDEDFTNNYKNNSFATAKHFDQTQVVLKIRTDDYARETYWEVHDVLGNVLEHGGNQLVGLNGGGEFPLGVEIGPGAYANNALIKDTLLLPGAGCYSIHFVDAFGDGICCDFGNGYYKLYNIDNPATPIIASGQFEKYDRHAFSAGTVSATSNVPTQNFDIQLFPNPATDLLTVDIETLYDDVLQLRVLNALGQTMLEYPIERIMAGSNTIQLPLAELANGLYFLSVASDQDGKRVALRKFVVSR